MIKLNGNIYLTEVEVEKTVYETSALFRTSHRVHPPQKITYLDTEFVEIIKDEAKNTALSLFYLYGYGENYAPVNKLTKAIGERCRDEASCSNKLYFMQYDLTDAQRKQHRMHYENFLINAFLEECIIKFKKLS
jgi:hypothetical protein|tara:strand:+ start:3733 stop:4134 length:402 start_codon:yes stop_codon:yes gene_type:complete